MKKQGEWVLNRWKPLVGALAAFLLIIFVLSYHVGSLTHGVSQAEQQYIISVRSGRQLLQSPLFLPHRLPVYILFKLHVGRIAAYRLVSSVFAFIMVVSGFYVLKRWYSLRVAVLGSWLLLGSAWVLHVGRLATSDSVYLLVMPIIAVIVWMNKTKRPDLAIIALTLLICLSLYIPGFIWFMLALIIWQGKSFWRAVKKQRWWMKTLCGLALIIAVVPLVIASLDSPRMLLLILGLPAKLPTIKQIGTNLVHIPSQLFLHGPTDSVRWLGRLPLLDVFSSVMLVIGMYSLRYHVGHMRTKLLTASTIILIFLIILGGVPLTPLISLVYLVIAAGIAFMLQQWFAVFPRNPLARGLAVGLVAVAVLLVSFYNVSQYFVAWPQTPATKRVFSNSLVK